MKKLLITLLLIVALAALTACNLTFVTSTEATTIDDVKIDSDAVTLVIKNGESYLTYSLKEEKLAELNAHCLLETINEEAELTYTAIDGEWGKQITAVGDLVNGATVEGKTSYIMLYTSVTAQHDTSAYATTYEIGEASVTSAGVSIDQLTVGNGTVIYIETIVF